MGFLENAGLDVRRVGSTPHSDGAPSLPVYPHDQDVFKAIWHV